MLAPVHRLRKDEIVKLSRSRCKHGHSYLEHYGCYQKEKDSTERVWMFDIETSSLNAVYGYVFSYCLKELRGEMKERVLSPKEILRQRFDKDLIKDLLKDLEQVDRLVVYYGKDGRHDVPFVRSRALLHGYEFPEYGTIKVTDMYDIVKKKLRLYNNRLKTACDYLDISSKAHPITPKIWAHAAVGDTKSLNYILEHNREDVDSLEELYIRTINFGSYYRASV